MKDIILTIIYEYSRFQWTNLELLDSDKVIPKETPPFIIHEITNDGKKTKTFIHLQQGISKSSYGDVLESYDVKEYCDTFNFNGKDWKLGDPSVCDFDSQILPNIGNFF